MASHTKTSGLPSAVDTVDLERAIHNLEFEKKQQIREIEKEKQQISFVEASLKEKQDDIQRMEANLTRLDEETKSFHKQFRQNKEQTESQKKHSAVLNIHITNKEKDVQQLVEKCEAELTTFHKKLEHYDQLWKSYEDIYMQQENAQELMKWQLEVLQCKEAIKEGGIQISRLREEEESLKKDIIASQPPFPNVTDFIIRIAEIKHSTTCNIKEIEDSLSTLFLVEKEVQILKEDQAKIVKKLEEKKRQEDEEREKNEKEKALQEELARKKRDEQHNATNPKQAGIYKLGQFTHRAATQPPAARVPPNTTKRSCAPTSRPPPSPRTPLLIPIPARSTTQSVPPPVGGVALSPNHPGGSQVGNRGGAPPLRIEDRGALPQQPRPPVTRPSQQGRILLNMPAQHRPVRQEWGTGRMQAPLMQLDARVNRPQQAAASDMEPNMDTTSRTALSNTMYNMSLAPALPGQLSPASIKPASPITPGSQGGPGQSGVQQLSPRNQTKQEPAVAQRKEPMVGPGGDAQPFPVKSPQQQPGSDEVESFTLSQPGSASDIGDGITMDIDEYPLTPGTDAGMETEALTKTPQTPGNQFLLGGRIRDEQVTKSPGFVYTSRAMFAGEGPQEHTQSSDNSCSGTDMFFNTFFGMGGSRSDPPVSTSMANMFGGGGNTPPQTAPSTATKHGGAMAMFGGGGAEVGDSPSPAPVMDLSESSHHQDQDQGASMGFSFNFGGSSPSTDEPGTGGGKSGFCLF